MQGLVLNDECMRLTMDGHGDRTLLEVRDETANRFWVATSQLEEILLGGEIRIFAHGGYCQLHVDGDLASLEYGQDGIVRGTCLFLVSLLAEGLAMVRSASLPEASSSTMIVEEG